MLSRVAKPARRENGEECGAISRSAAYVTTHGCRLEAHTVAGIPEPFADVLVLAVEEESFVEAIDLLEQAPANEHAGTRGPLRFRDVLVRGRISDHFVDPTCGREQPVEKQGLRERRPQSREATKRELQGAVLAENPRHSSSYAGIVGQRGDKTGDRVDIDSCVRIHEQDEGGAACAPATVTAASKTAVRFLADDREREIGDRLDIGVGRVVVDDDDVDLGRGDQRLYTPAKLGTAVVRDCNGIDERHM